MGGAISGATNLKTLKLHVKTEWMSNGVRRPTPFTLEDALGMMLRSENSRLRMIAVDRLQYTVSHFMCLWDVNKRSISCDVVGKLGSR